MSRPSPSTLFSHFLPKELAPYTPHRATSSPETRSPDPPHPDATSIPVPLSPSPEPKALARSDPSILPPHSARARSDSTFRVCHSAIRHFSIPASTPSPSPEDPTPAQSPVLSLSRPT